jgi:hypothetical protein
VYGVLHKIPWTIHTEEARVKNLKMQFRRALEAALGNVRKSKPKYVFKSTLMLKSYYNVL